MQLGYLRTSIENLLKQRWLHHIGEGSLRRVVQEAFWIIVGQAATVLGGLVGVRILTELLTPVEFGHLSLAMTVALMVNQTLLGPLSSGATRFYAPAREAGEFHSYISSVRRLTLVSTGIVAFIALLSIVSALFVGQSQWIGLIAAALGFALLSGYNSILSGIQNAARQRTVVALHQGLAAWGRILLATVGVLLIRPSSEAAMLGYGLAMLLVLVSQYAFFARLVNSSLSIVSTESHTTKNAEWRRQIIFYSWPFASWGVFTWLQMSSDRWALQVYASTEDVGLYAALYQLGYYPITMLVGLVVQLLAPMLFQLAGDASDARRMQKVQNVNRNLVGAALAITVLVVAISLVFHQLIFSWLVAPRYRTVSWLLPWMALAGGLFASGQIAALSQLSRTETHRLIAPKVVVALIGLLLNFTGAYLWGITGVVLASVLTSFIYLVWLLAVNTLLEKTQAHEKHS